MPAAIANAEFNLVDAEIHQASGGIDVEFNIGMQLLEMTKARHEPARRNGGFDRDIERAGSANGGGFARGIGQSIKEGRQLLAKALAGLGEGNATASAQEELGAEIFLQLADMAADGGMGDEKLARSLGKTHMPRGSFESFESVE